MLLQTLLESDEALRGLAEAAASRGLSLHLVGGAVRDLLLGRSGRSDLDLVVPRGAVDLAHAYADAAGGTYVPLDEHRGIARIALREGDGHREIDLADYQRGTLDEDLRSRDFTINAMAIDLSGLALVDPTGGREDLERRAVRVPSPSVLDDDPLRVLRAYRFAAVLGFGLDAATRQAVVACARKLERIAGERVRDELFKILAADAAWTQVAWMEEDGVLAVLFPELEALRGLQQAGFHHLDAYRHSLMACEMVEAESLPLGLASLEDPEPLRAYLSRAVTGGRTRRALLLMGALLHDVGKKLSQQVDEETGRITYRGHDLTGADLSDGIAGRLKLSRAETAILRGMVRWHLRPLDMPPLADLKPRTVRHFFRDCGNAAVDTLLVALADNAASRGPRNTPAIRQEVRERIAWMLRWHFAPRPDTEHPLLDGNEVARIARIPPGAALGTLLERLMDAQADGEVRTRAEAEDFVRSVRPWT